MVWIHLVSIYITHGGFVRLSFTWKGLLRKRNIYSSWYSNGSSEPAITPLVLQVEHETELSSNTSCLWLLLLESWYSTFHSIIKQTEFYCKRVRNHFAIRIKSILMLLRILQFKNRLLINTEYMQGVLLSSPLSQKKNFWTTRSCQTRVGVIEVLFLYILGFHPTPLNSWDPWGVRRELLKIHSVGCHLISVVINDKTNRVLTILLKVLNPIWRPIISMDLNAE